MAHKPELGIKDPYELNEDQYKAALDLLRVQRTLVGRYWHDAFIQMDDFKNEGVVASGSWPFQVNVLKAEKQPVASVFPEGRHHRLGRHDHAARRQRASQLRLYVDGAFAVAQGAGRRLGLVRHGSVGSRRLQGQRAADRRRLRDQRLRQLRQDQVLEDAGRRNAPARANACPITAGCRTISA